MAKLLSTLAVVAGLISATLIPARADDWPVFGYDPARSGFNSAEQTLTVGNVHKLKERWQTSLGDASQASPILLQRVRIGKHYRTMLYETTQGGVTIGVDASSGHIVWRYTSHGVNITTSAPAADPSGKAIYAAGIDGKVHKLSAARGRDRKSVV